MQVIKSIFMIIGSIVGAGFASGKEITIYFAQYGNISLLFIIPIFFIFFYLIYFTIKFGNLNNNIKFNKINNILFKKYNKIFIIFNFICLFIICSAMCSALIEIINTQNNLINLLIIFIVYFILILICKYGINLLSNITLLLIPIIIIMMLITLLSNLNPVNIFISNNYWYILPINSISYTIMNIYLSIYIIISSSKNFNKKQLILTSFISSLFICILLSIAILVLNGNTNVINDTFPILSLSRKNELLYSIYYFVFISAIITTLFSSIISAKALLNLKFQKYSILILPMLVLVSSFFGFSNFISYLYPVISIVGVFTFYKILFFKPVFYESYKSIHSTSKKT